MSCDDSPQQSDSQQSDSQHSDSQLGAAEDWLLRFRQVHPSAACRDHDPKFGPVFVRGAGSRLWDVQGREFIDLTCGYSAASFGQAFPPLVDAATRQLHRLTHVTGEPHVGRIELAERLLQLFQFAPNDSRVMFNVTGARAVETAWKAAVAFRPGKLLTVGPCYHGRSIATLALAPLPQKSHASPSPSHAATAFSSHDSPSRETSSPQQHPSSWQSQVINAPIDAYPYCAVCPLGLKYPSCELKCVRPVLQTIADRAGEISAVLVEPAIGARGTIAPPSEFLLKLRQLTQQHDILLIADEIQTGLGRYGSLSLAHSQGWRPDLLIIGKSLGGGLVPISAVLGRAVVLESLPIGSESETYAASPLATAVAMEVVHQLCSGPWMARGAELGARLRALVSDELGCNDPGRGVGSVVVEGAGACCVIEFAQASSKQQGAAVARQLAEMCLRNGLLTQLSGPHLSRLALFPAFTMSDAEYECAALRLQNACSSVKYPSPPESAH